MKLLNTKIKYYYNLYGFNIKSDFYLSELSSNLTTCNTNTDIDIQIIDGICPNEIPDIINSNNYYTVSKTEAMFSPSECGHFYISNGNKIIVEPINNTNYDHLKAYLLSRAFAILLFQRNILALHGSSIIFNDKAYTFCGQSGAGKSSLGASLCLKGYNMLSDDLSVVTIDNNKPLVHPGFAQHKLCKDTMEYFNFSTNNLKVIDNFAEKYSFNIDNNFEKRVSPLSVIIEISLNYKINDTKVSLTELHGGEKIQTIFRNIFSNRLLTDIGINPLYLKKCLTLSKNVKVYKLTRPANKFTLDEQIELIKTIQG